MQARSRIRYAFSNARATELSCPIELPTSNRYKMPRRDMRAWSRSSSTARGKLSVRYSPFGRNGTFPGPSRSEHINWRRQSKPSSSGAFVFSEATRTVYLAPAQQRELSTISDAETLCRFERLDADTIAGRQRVLRYLTPNPNSAEGVLWGETNGRQSRPSSTSFCFGGFRWAKRFIGQKWAY